MQFEYFKVNKKNFLGHLTITSLFSCSSLCSCILKNLVKENSLKNVYREHALCVSISVNNPQKMRKLSFHTYFKVHERRFFFRGKE